MSGKRMLHKNVCESEKLSRISYEAEALYYRLLTRVDDNGNFHANPRLVQTNCLPLRETVMTEQVAAWVRELVNIGLLSEYTANDRGYLHIARFEDFQTLRQYVNRYSEHPVHPPELGMVFCKERQPSLPLGQPSPTLDPSHTLAQPRLSPDEKSVLEHNLTQENIREGSAAFTTPPEPLAFSGDRMRLTQVEHAALKARFPGFLEQELQMLYRKMDAWCVRKKARGQKKDWPKFAANWLADEEPLNGGRAPAPMKPGSTRQEIEDLRRRRENISPEAAKRIDEIRRKARKEMTA